MTTAGPFRILCVCTGNICRSPVAERFLASRLGPDVVVGSAGTYAVTGAPIAGSMASLLHGAGVPADGFAARQVSIESLRSADLVLAMTKGHRSEVVGLAPAVVRRAFTLREFARLLVELGPEELPVASPAGRLRSAVSVLAGRRSRSVTSDDIDDPFGLSETAYRRAFREIDEATALIAAVGRAAGDPA